MHHLFYSILVFPFQVTDLETPTRSLLLELTGLIGKIISPIPAGTNQNVVWCGV